MSARNLFVLVACALALTPAAARAADYDPDGPAPAARAGLAETKSTVLGVPLRLGGYFWSDIGYMKRSNERQGQYDQEATYIQGRVVLQAEHVSVHGDCLFAAAKAEIIAFENEYTKSQYEPHVLDVYAQIGGALWDVQVGRFLAWEVYSRGQGIELYTAEEAGALGGPPLTWLNLTRGHKNEAGQLAVHLYPTDWLGFEIAGVYGQESNQNNLGVRPVFRIQWEGLELIGGWEYLAQLPQTSADKVEVTSQGFAAKLQYRFPYVTAGFSAATASVEHIDIQGLVDSERTLDRTSLGGFVDVDFADSSIGLVYHYTMQKNEQKEDNRHHQAFVSFLQRLPVDGFALKLVYGFASAHIQDADVRSEWDNEMHSVRLRVIYDFK
ncbi:MAG: hypothetical protein IT385_15065 [Deltaproteobacteria bacterium]|nr:hypothetical protein [Deltaproteobacteria bacterium]